MKVGTALRTAMKIRSITQDKLAELVSYSGSSAIRNTLTRPSGVRSDVLLKLFDALGYEIIIRDKISGKDLCTLTNEDPT